MQLEKLISPFIHEELLYKIIEQKNKHIFLQEILPNVLVVDTINFQKEKKEVFDIEIEDNHNFVISASSGGKNKRFGGPVVHNCQNTNKHEIKTILTRVGNGSKIIILGDIEQIDNPHLDETSNGLTHAIEKLKPYDVSGHITLVQGERSKVATICANVL